MDDVSRNLGQQLSGLAAQQQGAAGLGQELAALAAATEAQTARTILDTIAVESATGTGASLVPNNAARARHVK